MSDSIKDNAEILADQQAFMAAYRRAKELFGTYEGVEGVGYGQKQTGDDYKESIAIIVYVREKKPEEAISPEQRIPKTFEGYLTDVRVVVQTHPRACTPITDTFKKIQGGIQVSPVVNPTSGRFEVGTLACIVRKRNDSGRDNVYLLSNKHVLFNAWAGVGDYIYHPFAPTPSGFASIGESHALGPVQPRSFYGNEQAGVDDPTTPNTVLFDDFYIDCAIARIDIDSICCGSPCTKDKIETAESIVELLVTPGNVITDVRNLFGDLSIVGKKVFKVGRTTRRTTGIVRGVTAHALVALDFTVPLGAKFTATNMIEIQFDPASDPTHKNCAGHGWFSELGDSGALIVDEQGRAVGVVSQGPTGTDPDGSPDFACHIVPILDKLEICIPTSTGTSHGSTRATDGSGLAPFRSAADPTLFPTGKIVFTGEEASSPAWPAPAPLTDEEERHMRELLDALRSTRRGRELHELFGQVRREVAYLIRNHKLVKVAWHRYKGPAFMAHVLNHLKGYTDRVPREVDGVSAVTLLERMAELLARYGSNPLRDAIQKHSDEVRSLLASGDFNSVDDCIAYLKASEAAA